MKKNKAQLWDMVQYIFRNYYDRMMHAILWFDGVVDSAAVRASIGHIVDRVEVLRSTFRAGFFRPKWVVNDLDEVGQLVQVVDTDDVEKAAFECISQSFSYKEKLQIRVFIVQDDTKNAIAFLVNHMCFDGGDFGYFLGKFVECYNNYLRTGSCEDVEIKTGSRDADQLYQGTVDPQKIKLDGLEMTDAFMTGATKYKPYVQVTFNGFAGEGRLCIAQKCSQKDQKSYRIFLTI